MSKNYEFLRAAEKDLELFRTDIAAGYDRSDRNGNGHARDRVRDEVLRLIQRVFQCDGRSAPRMVAFSAVEHGNGCSWVSARVGEALAAYGAGTVCLVDANLHSPMLHRYFGVSSRSSLADALLQQGPVHNFAQPIQGSNLWLLSGRALPSDSVGMMSRERLRLRFTELCSEFAYVLVDAPPVNESAESVMLGQIADGLVLILEANSTRREAARKAIKSLEAGRVKLLGTVLNKRTFPIPHALYTRL